jgi:hypothetical protein
MSKIDDGGPAFPLSADAAINPVTNVYGADISSGLTKRDYFAAAAMTGLAARMGAACGYKHQYAKAAFEYADAMIAASKTGGPEHG